MAKKKKKSKSNPGKNSAKKAAKAEKKTAKGNKSSKRVSWLDDTGMPQLNDQARKLQSFVQAMADGKVEQSEIDDQEKRLVKLMKKVEPQLDDEAHADVTELLCELTAYDLMQTLHMMQQARPASTFRG
jgi:hypothetical protein